MTAAEQSADAKLADNAEDRTKLLAKLARAAATPTGRWLVLRQLFVAGEVVEQPACGHRFAWVAQLCAHRRERQHPDQTGVHYTVRRAER